MYPARLGGTALAAVLALLGAPAMAAEVHEPTAMPAGATAETLAERVGAVRAALQHRAAEAVVRPPGNAADDPSRSNRPIVAQWWNFPNWWNNWPNWWRNW